MNGIAFNQLIDHDHVGYGVGAVAHQLQGGEIAHQVGVELTILLRTPRKRFVCSDKGKE